MKHPKNSQSKGIFYLDLLFSFLLLSLIFYTGFLTSTTLNERAAEHQQKHSTYGKLLSISDHLVKDLLAEQSENAIYHHQIDPSKYPLTSEKIDNLKSSMHLRRIEASLSAPPQCESCTCISRIVLFNNEIRKLTVCGR